MEVSLSLKTAAALVIARMSKIFASQFGVVGKLLVVRRLAPFPQIPGLQGTRADWSWRASVLQSGRNLLENFSENLDLIVRRITRRESRFAVTPRARIQETRWLAQNFSLTMPPKSRARGLRIHDNQRVLVRRSS